MKDPAGATVLVTGATDGLGRRVALQLAEMGATVLLHGRSRDRCEAVLEEVRRETGAGESRCYLADLSSLSAVRGLAEQILSEHGRLDVLVNNAGIIAREREETAMARSQPTTPESPMEPGARGPERIRQDCPSQATSAAEVNHAGHD